MLYVRVAAFATAVLWTVSGAWAQYGFSGSPQMIRLPSVGGGAIEQPIHSTTTVPSSPQLLAEAPRPMPALTSAGPNVLVQATVAEPPVPGPPAEPAQAAPAPSVLDQLMQESGAPAADCSATAVGCGEPGSGAYGACGDYFECQPSAVCPWYITASGLVMGRNDANKVWTTYDSNNNANQVLNTEDARSDWSGGAEIRLGRRFCCGTWAVEGTFWTLEEMDNLAGLAVESGSGGLSTPLDFDGMRFAFDPSPDAPDRPQFLFDGADAQYVRRINEFYNVELNLVRNSTRFCGPLDVDVLFGVRWFRFREHLTYASLDQDGGDWSNLEATGYLDDSIKNDLFGGQVGLHAGYDLGYCLRLFARPKIGIYNNHIEHTFSGFRGDGELFAPATDSGIDGTFPVRSDKDVVSFLTEIDLGIDWTFHPQWSAFLGYRVLVATGIGLADDQLTPYPVDIPEEADIDHNGTLILHGVFTGVSHSF